MDWILLNVSETSPEHLTGIGVEPAAEHAQALQPMVEQSLPGVALVQCAISDADGKSQLHLVHKHQSAIWHVPWWQRDDFERHLSYLLNMSCVGREHPDLQHYLKRIRAEFGVQLDLQQTSVPIWSWESLAREFNFGGCEVLIVDTEGFDVRILKSMIAHCSKREDCWPHVIQFETMGHSDKIDGNGSEWGIISQLSAAGYILVYYSKYNTYLAHWEALWYKSRVKSWARTLVCSWCRKQEHFPYLTVDRKVYCQACAHDR